MMNHKKMMGRLKTSDMILVKVSIATATLFTITIWPAAMTWVHGVNPWYFFTASVGISLLLFHKTGAFK